MWELLPAFCNYASDTAPSFRLLAKTLAETAAADAALRRPIVRALKVLVAQNREAAGMASRAAAGLRLALEGEAGRDEREDEEGASEFGGDREAEEAEAEAVQGPALRRAKAALTPEVAQQNIRSIAVFAPRFYPILFEAHLSAPPNMRGDLQVLQGKEPCLVAAVIDAACFMRYYQVALHDRGCSTCNGMESCSGWRVPVVRWMASQRPFLPACNASVGVAGGHRTAGVDHGPASPEAALLVAHAQAPPDHSAALAAGIGSPRGGCPRRPRANPSGCGSPGAAACVPHGPGLAPAGRASGCGLLPGMCTSSGAIEVREHAPPVAHASTDELTPGRECV